MTPPADTDQENPPPDLASRVTALETAMQTHEERLKKGSEAMLQMHADLKANTVATVAIKTDTGEIIAFFESAKGAFKALDMLGKLAKPLGYITALVAGVLSAWAAFKHGGPPA